MEKFASIIARVFSSFGIPIAASITMTIAIPIATAQTSTAASSAVSRLQYCKTLFNPAQIIEPSSHSLTLLRREILKANLHDRTKNRQAALFSNFIEGRGVDITPPQESGYQVVSLGSGPDIFLPLYLYPNAREIHLVDGLGNWGSGPLEIIEEIQTRLLTLVTYASDGSGGSIERLDQQGSARHIDGFLKGPLIWRVRWNNTETGPQEKIIQLHQANFDNRAQMRALGFTDLGGIVITGITPSAWTHRFFLSRLRPGGSLFTEFYTRHSKQTKTFKNIKKSYAVIDHGPTDDDRYLGGLFASLAPHIYEVRPVDPAEEKPSFLKRLLHPLKSR